MIYPFGFLAVFAIYAGRVSLANICSEYTKHIDVHHPTSTYQSPNPLGKWSSSRCEITPGRKFIIRRFDIQPFIFFAFIYHYKDSWCRQPTFIIKVKGSYELLPGTATPNSKSSFATNFNFDEIYIRVFTVQQLEMTINEIIRKCPLALPSEFQIKENQTINSADYLGVDIRLPKQILKKKACRYYFGLHINSYKKIRMVKTDKRKSGIKYDELFFGDIPAKSEDHKGYTHVEFQYSLSRLDKPDCDVCKLVQDVNDVPILRRPPPVKSFKGEWITEICEAQDDTRFVTKYYYFTDLLPGKKYGIVKIYQSYFSDSDCTQRTFDMKTGGIYYDVKPDGKVEGVVGLMLRITWLSLAAFDEINLKIMQGGENCGIADNWEYGVEQNITSTNGCQELNLKVPQNFKMKTRIISKESGDTELYINDEKPGKFFTNNLIKCNSVKINISKYTTKPPRRDTQQPIDFLPIDNSVNRQIETVIQNEVKNDRNNTVRLKYSFLLLIFSLLMILMIK